MAAALLTNGQLFTAKFDSENQFYYDTTNYPVSGIYSIPDTPYLSDFDNGLLDSQQLSNVDYTTANANRLGTVTLTDLTPFGAVNGPSTNFDIVGTQTNSDGSTFYLLGQQPYDPTNSQASGYYQGLVIVSTKDISTVDNDGPSFPLIFSRTGNAAAPLAPDNIAQALDGTTLDYLNGTTGFQQIRGNRVVTNADGSLTIPVNGSLPPISPGLNATFTYIGTVPFGTGTISGVLSAFLEGSPLIVAVVAFDATHVYLEGLTLSGNTYVLNANRFLITDGGPDLDLTTGGSTTPTPLTLYTTGATYTSIGGTTYPMPCFARGTRIAVPGGETAVEHLSIGDLVLSHTGETREIIWVGSREIDIARHPMPETVRPIVIRRNAFADNVPARDLVVSPDHNVFVDGVLIPAKCLVNGRSILVSDVDRVSYHHVELAQHDVVLAEGLPTETYLDTGNRAAFVGGATVDAFPDFASAPDLNYFVWEAQGCARLVLAGPELDAVRVMLACRLDTLFVNERAAA